jgi:hypothetical protein
LVGVETQKPTAKPSFPSTPPCAPVFTRFYLVAGGSYGTTNVWEVATGRHLVTLFAFRATERDTALDDWLAYTPDGFYEGSRGVERYLAWRVGEDLKTPDSVGVPLHRPDRLESALKLLLPKPSSR